MLLATKLNEPLNRAAFFRTDRSTFGRSTPFSREHLWALGVRRKIRVILRMMYTCVSDLAACCADSWRTSLS
jgi:hypothetical protein